MPVHCWHAYVCMQTLVCSWLHAYVGMLMSACMRLTTYVCMHILVCLCLHAHAGLLIAWPLCSCLHWYAYVCMQTFWHAYVPTFIHALTPPCMASTPITHTCAQTPTHGSAYAYADKYAKKKVQA